MSDYDYTYAGNFLSSGTGGERLNVQHPRFAGGAVGNGVANDTLAIQAAIDAAEPGDEVFFPRPPAHYRISDTLVLTGKDEIALTGPHGASSMIWFDSVNKNAIVSLLGARGIKMVNMRLYSANPVTPPRCFIMMGRTSPQSFGSHKLYNCEINGYASDAGIYNVASEENLIIGCYVGIDGGAAKYNYFLSERDDLAFGGLVESTALSNWIIGARMTRWTPFVGTDDETAALIRVNARGSTGDFVVRDSFFATKGGSFVSIHVPDAGAVGMGPFVFADSRTESLEGQKYGFRASGAAGTMLRQVHLDRLHMSNLRIGDSYYIYATDDVALDECRFTSSRAIRDAPESANAPSSIHTVTNTVIETTPLPTIRSLPAGAGALRLREAQRTVLCGRQTYQFNGPANGGSEFFVMAVPGAEVGDFVEAALGSGSTPSINVSGYVNAANSVVFKLVNASADPYLENVLCRVEVRKPYA